MYKLFISDFETNDSRIIKRLILVNAIFLLGFFTLLFFTFFNYFVQQDKVIAFLNALFAVIAAILFFDLRINKNLNRACYFSVAAFFIFIVFFVHFNQNESFGLIWTQMLPLMVVGLIGSKRGILINLVYYIVIFFMAYKGIGTWDSGSWDLVSFFRLVAASFFMLLIVTGFDIALERSNKLLEYHSVTDSLTELYNRRKLTDIINIEVERAIRYKSTVSLILLDVDDFKKINDTLGHKGGDDALVALARTINSQLRSSDAVGRWGGEEFLIVNPETTLAEAKAIAEKLRITVENIDFEVPISCSFGVRELDQERDSVDSFIHLTDEAMYRAKTQGKNAVYVST